jgi:hypothetical protein
MYEYLFFFTSLFHRRRLHHRLDAPLGSDIYGEKNEIVDGREKEERKKNSKLVQAKQSESEKKEIGEV